MKTLSLLRAVLTEDMDLFKYKVGTNASRLKKILLPVFLFIVVGYSIGYYAYMIGKPLYEVGLTYIMLSLFIFMVSIITIIEGIYKSQGILFEAKDNDLLFSLPISRGKILFVRIFKLILFQYIYNLMFLLPAFVIYIYFEKPGISFYLISLLMTVLIPIIPTVISSILGYLIKIVSSRFKFKKIMQTILSCTIFMGIFLLSFNFNNFISDIASKATGINDILTRIYYPVGAYVTLINKFDIVVLIKLLFINIIPFVLFILVGSRYYFKIISNSRDSVTRGNKRKKEVFKKNSSIMALTKKELKRYFSSPVYMFNTIFGLLLIFVITVFLCIKGDSVLDMFLNSEGIGDIDISMPIIYYVLVLFSCAMTSITSSSISLEGRTINITKSLPVSERDILKSKIVYCYFIELPFILVSEFIFFIVFKVSFVDILLILGIGFVMVTLSSIVGLLVNLKYPKMNASSDTEVVKQSISSMISVFIGMGIFIGSLIVGMLLYDKVDIYLLLGLHMVILLVVTIILYIILMNKGTREYRNINV